MLFRQAIEQIKGFRFIIDNLTLRSSLARHYLHASEYMTNIRDIEDILNKIEKTYLVTGNDSHTEIVDTIKLKLSQVRDIRGTLKNLQNKTVLDDIQLFELKYFGLLCIDIKHLISQLDLSFILLPGLDKAIKLLDPDSQYLPNFYIYDSYSVQLTKLRTEIKNKQKELETLKQNYSADIYEKKAWDIETIRQQSIIIEDEIREKLSSDLHSYTQDFNTALKEVAQLDILIAKAEQAKKMHLNKPSISSDTSCYHALFFPPLKNRLESQGKSYQAIDITIKKNPCLITGANMTGKTILLKAVGLAQVLMQFGFFVPAKTARIAIVDKILYSMDDGQSELSGLSSFAAEMMTINTIIEDVKKDTNVLVLIDELARSTNPYEGKAIVHAMLDILSEYKVRSLITTHYNIKTTCKKLKVKGFLEEKENQNPTIENIQEFIDYSLISDDQEEVPHEALHIASILGIETSLIEKAIKYLESLE